MQKIWIDDERPMPKVYNIHIHSVYEFITWFVKKCYTNDTDHTLLIDLDHDAGMYARDGGDYIKVLEYLEYLNHNMPQLIHGFKFQFKIHSGNPVGRANMRSVIESNGWEIID